MWNYSWSNWSDNSHRFYAICLLDYNMAVMRELPPYPRLEEVEAANRPTLYKWWKNLPNPGAATEGYLNVTLAELTTKEERLIRDRILERLHELGGFL